MHALNQPGTRISLIALLSRRPALAAAEVTLEAWLLASGWVRDPASPRFPWADPDGLDTWSLRDAVRAQAQTTAARKLRRRGWTVGTVGPGASLGPGWCEGPHSRKQVTLATALRAESLEAIWL